MSAIWLFWAFYLLVGIVISKKGLEHAPYTQITWSQSLSAEQSRKALPL